MNIFSFKEENIMSKQNCFFSYHKYFQIYSSTEDTYYFNDRLIKLFCSFFSKFINPVSTLKQNFIELTAFVYRRYVDNVILYPLSSNLIDLSGILRKHMYVLKDTKFALSYTSVSAEIY
jgi:hypothetical protein